jgi:pyruvate dehydrogenase complex dehydrogenase (E1) component
MKKEHHRKSDPEQRAAMPSRRRHQTGYRKDRKRHVAAAFKIPKAQRIARAKAGAAGLAAKKRKEAKHK